MPAPPVPAPPNPAPIDVPPPPLNVAPSLNPLAPTQPAFPSTSFAPVLSPLIRSMSRSTPRKSDDGDTVMASTTPSRTSSMKSTTPSRTPSRTTTPGRSPSARTPTRTPTRPPTPARDILRTDPENEGKVARVTPRPPTPPRPVARTPAQGYFGLGMGTPKRPRSPRSPKDTFKAPRLLEGDHMRPRQTSLSTFFTPQPPRHIPTLPSTVAAERRIAPLPRLPPLSAKPPNSRLPRPPVTPRLTVPVPFGGRVGESTAASLLKSTKRPDKALAAPADEVSEAKCLAPTPARKTALPVRRPSTRSTTAPARRHPSYPSSLGSGPPARQTNRVVSNPITTQPDSMEIDESSARPIASEPTPRPSASEPPRLSARASEPNRTVVRPDVAHKRDSLSMPSRREGYDDTARNLSALNAALANLRIPSKARETDSVRPRPRPPTPTVASTPAPAPTAVTSTPRPRNLSSRPPLAPDKGRLESLMNTESKLFKGVTAYVDVRNEDGVDVGSSFVEMLRNGGARVVSRPTESCTHFIYKGGRPNTAAFWRRMDAARRPHVVGLRWLVNSLKAGRREDEVEHTVDFAHEVVFQKRTKSMEPKVLKRLGPIAEAPFRAYTPKVSSPLRPMYE
ncbi:hypothetical protein CC85DRAFT_326690 [Cutaneotrichosporon oleaginosum]|uniref:BRCT domain-containing protein n=1 Tax=Cutaneotrichosporon oleaginosum TaxID=879819 RepID=A0A0J0XT70_9TREE|nr:uncharacterized protein CC85DRAFT_326690 [Cutaneotrichosporon oleaginosum]KLT44277.1 hypothetical protein CC85DRAFT_326690 [Cutaneotrichosporon oleaginosum]TXT11555.1 hypothetical protein COLE_01965 [Cutaneotrichosporon oleaginosum]